MQFDVPPDLEAIVQKQLATGAFTDVEDVIRCALENLNAAQWSEDESLALDAKIDEARDEIASGKAYGPEAARQRLAELRKAHLAELG